MNCSECQDLILPYLLGALSPAEAEAVRAHLQTGCASCADELAATEATLSQIPRSLTPVPPPPKLRARLLERVRSGGRNARAREPIRDGAPPRRWRWAEPLVAGALAASVTAALLWVRIERQQQELADLRDQISRQEARVDQLQAGLNSQQDTIHLFASPAVQLVSLQGTAGQPSAKGRGFWDKDRRSFHLYVSGLKPLARDKSYELWFIDADQKKLPAGTFDVNARGEASLVATAPAPTGDKLAALAVTDEPAGGSAQPTGQIRLLGKPG